MGFRGLLRDFIGFYVGGRLLFGLIYPLTIHELVFSSLLLLFFSSWFLLERLGVFKK